MPRPSRPPGRRKKEEGRCGSWVDAEPGQGFGCWVAVVVPAAELVVLLQHGGEFDDLRLDSAVGEGLAGHAGRKAIVHAAEAGFLVEEAFEVPDALAGFQPLVRRNALAGAGG